MKTSYSTAVHSTTALLLATLAITACSDASDPPSAKSGASASSISYDELIALIADPDEFSKARKLGELLPSLGPDAVPTVKSVLAEAAPLEMGATEFELLLRYWASHEPREASLYALAESPRGYRWAAVHASLTTWARGNPQEALEATRIYTFEEGDVGAAAMVALVRGWIESGKPGIEEFIHDTGMGIQRQRAIYAYSIAKIRKDGTDAAREVGRGDPRRRPDLQARGVPQRRDRADFGRREGREPVLRRALRGAAGIQPAQADRQPLGGAGRAGRARVALDRAR